MSLDTFTMVFVITFVVLYAVWSLSFLLTVGYLPLDKLRCSRTGHIPKRFNQLVYETCNLGHKHRRYVVTNEWYCERCYKNLSVVDSLTGTSRLWIASD